MFQFSTSCFLCAGERPFKCESCNYLAANQHEVTRHARQVHNGPKPLSCPYCDYKTADRSNYKKHVELHLNPRQFLCPVCKYAASKKCNLQYHIKSRHAGCDVAVDISKVKLRVKKAAANGAQEDPQDREDREDRDKGTDANPINLSIRRSSRPGTSQPGTSRPGTSQPAQSEAAHKVQDKSSRWDRERLGRVKEQEKRITTRQKVKRAPEKVPEEEVHAGSTAATKMVEGKAKTKVRKLQVEEAALQKPTEDQSQSLKAEQGQPEEKRRMRPDKDKENQSSESSRKKKKKKKGLSRSRKSGSEKVSRHADGSQQNLGGLQQTQEKKAAKAKAPKRKCAEAPGPTQSPSDLPPKTRRTKGAEKLSPVAGGPGKTGDTRSNGTFATKQKKSRTVSGSEDNSEMSGGPAGPPGPARDPGPSSPAKKEDSPGASGEPRRAQDGPPKPTEARLSLDPQSPEEPVPAPPGPPAPEPPAAPAAPAQPVSGPAEKMADASLMFSPPTSSPTFVLPVHLDKPAEPEDDEGIHSSHEGGSDISDSASEGSEDSGLNSNGGKLAADPETPTAEMPTPPQLRGHMCIFCDRSFPLETAYRRHLKRHLVNVYYMEPAGGGQS